VGWVVDGTSSVLFVWPRSSFVCLLIIIIIINLSGRGRRELEATNYDRVRARFAGGWEFPYTAAILSSTSSSSIISPLPTCDKCPRISRALLKLARSPLMPDGIRLAECTVDGGAAAMPFREIFKQLR
jgi:hypothetical protein